MVDEPNEDGGMGCARDWQRGDMALEWRARSWKRMCQAQELGVPCLRWLEPAEIRIDGANAIGWDRVVA